MLQFLEHSLESSERIPKSTIQKKTYSEVRIGYNINFRRLAYIDLEEQKKTVSVGMSSHAPKDKVIERVRVRLFCD